MRTCLFVISFLFIYNTHAQQAAAKPFPVRIEGTIKNLNGRYVYLHWRASDKEARDSAKISGEKFAFRIKASYPDIYWFSLSPEPQNQPACYFFVDNAPVKATLKHDSLPWSKVEGGKAHQDYLEYRAVINSFVAIQMRMQEDFNTAAQQNDVNTQNAIRTEFQNLNGQYLNALKSFVRTHPASPVSAFVIQTDLNNPNIPMQETIEATGYLDKSLAYHPYYKQAEKRLEKARGTTVGYKALDFSQATPDGKKVSLSDFRGKYVLLDFWASWCRPCRMENPNVVAAYQRFKDKGFTILAVSMDTDMNKWLSAIQQDGLTWTHVSDLKGWQNEVGQLYGVSGIPQNYLIDREGKIVAKDLRGAALDEKLAEILK